MPAYMCVSVNVKICICFEVAPQGCNIRNYSVVTDK